MDLAKQIKNRIKYIQKTWDLYTSKDEAKRYNNMLGMVHDYMHMTDSNMSETEILYYIARELGVDEKVKQYDGIKEDEESFKEEYGLNLYDSCDEEVMDNMVKFEIESNIKERLVYITVKKIVINQLFSDNPSDLYTLIGNNEQKQLNGTSKCKIVKFNPNIKK